MQPLLSLLGLVVGIASILAETYINVSKASVAQKSHVAYPYILVCCKTWHLSTHRI